VGAPLPSWPVKRLGVPIIAAVVAAALIGLLGYGLSSRGGDRTLDEAVARNERPAAPSSTLPVLGSTAKRTLAGLRGKVVVLNFWASWCTPCKTEAPALAATQRRLERDGTGTVIGVTRDDSTPDSLAKVREWKVNYPSLRDVDNLLAKKYGSKSVPETFVIDARGRVVALSRGQIDQAFLDDAIRTAIQ
jgi:cytochrome c biogenesis protein CcmG/thiol:disulfide interchange protein DsbE